jgi:HEAT repeat protein
MDEQLNRIAVKLAEAADSPRLATGFGVQRHGFRLAPPLPPAEAAQFEAAHRIALPPAYRRFITELGNGGAGPSYGLLPLSQGCAEASGTSDRLAEPSYFAPGTHFEDTWWDERCDAEDEEAPLRGCLAIVHHGCTGYSYLVVTGTAAGRMVNLDYNGVPVPYVTEDADFLAWYERWLDELLAGYTVTEFGRKLPGDEAALLNVIAADHDLDRRARAIQSLIYLPQLSASADPVLIAAAETDRRLRRQVLPVARQFRRPPLLAIAETTLTDADATMRAEALTALRWAEAPRLADLARPLLADDADNVKQQAIMALEAAGALHVTDLAPLLDDTSPATRGWAALFLSRAAGDPRPGLERALADPAAGVRTYAVQAVGRLQLTALIPMLERMRRNETDDTVRLNLDRALPGLAR